MPNATLPPIVQQRLHLLADKGRRALEILADPGTEADARPALQRVQAELDRVREGITEVVVLWNVGPWEGR